MKENKIVFGTFGAFLILLIVYECLGSISTFIQSQRYQDGIYEANVTIQDAKTFEMTTDVLNVKVMGNYVVRIIFKDGSYIQKDNNWSGGRIEEKYRKTLDGSIIEIKLLDGISTMVTINYNGKVTNFIIRI